ncbi:MAG: hypothetical protein ABI946_03465 [Chthoniobacterales bacterium]
MVAHLDANISEITDPDILSLLDEIDHITGLDRRRFGSLTVMLYLGLSSHPDGAGTRRIPLASSRAIPGLLLTQTERIESHSVMQLCQDLAGRAHVPIQLYENRKLMTFLNAAFKNLADRAKRKRRR